MTNPNVEQNVRGYTGASVAELPESLWQITEDDGYEDHVLTINVRLVDHYFHVAVEHATALVDRLIAQRQSPTTDTTDLDAMVTQVTPAETLGQHGYAEGFCQSLVVQANFLRDRVAWLEEGVGATGRIEIGEFLERIAGLSRPTVDTLIDDLPGLGIGDGDSVDELFRRAGGLSKIEVLELADQLEYFTRSVSRRAQIPLPLALQPADQGYDGPREDDVAARELAVLVDQYSAVRAVPHLAGPTASGRADYRERLAARIAAAATSRPSLLRELPPDRVEVIRFLAPATANAAALAAVAAQSPRTPSQESLPAAAAELYETTGALIRAMNTPASEVSNRGQLLRQVTALHERDPAIAEQLPTTHAGVSREIAARFGRNSTMGSPVVGQTMAQTTETVAGNAHTLDPSRQELLEPPGTAGSRHAAGTRPPGSTRGR
ncbi:hypothetical protein [Actinophytocola sp.]|uniref:hypothetical protein n=1 Tax=Actinophytocola sp. TaxID=1872138 RepID=UPI003899C130